MPAFFVHTVPIRPVKLDSGNLIADRLAAPSAGAASYEIVRQRFADVVLVDDRQIANALALLMTRCNLFAEPAGAAATSTWIGWPKSLPITIYADLTAWRRLANAEAM